MGSIDLAEVRDLALDLAARASALVIDGLGNAWASAETKSTPTDLVTAMDRASEALIVAGIRAARPNDGFIGEEGADEPGSTGVRWLIDPIDGTTNYLYGNPGFAVSIAATFSDHAIVGVVQDCLLAEVFMAVRGEGATRNGVPIFCSTATELSTSLVATGFSYDPLRRVHQAEVLGKVIGKVRDIRRRGAASLDLCWVACGRFDAYYERGLGPWDVAAGDLIAREAGARTGGLDSAHAGYSVLAAGPGIYDELHELLHAAGAHLA